MTIDVALTRLELLYDLPFQQHKISPDQAAEIMGLAVKYSKGYYDMSYFYLAGKIDCLWCTADAKFLRAVPADFPKQRVLLLSMR
jgi:predicted nucleic acid-binding protein